MAVVALGILVLINILRIHARSPGAPSFSRGLLLFAGVVLAGLCLFYGYALIEALRYRGRSSLPVNPRESTAVLLNLLYVAAWYLYWQRSPRVREVFGETGGVAVDTAPAGVQLSRLAAISICLAGLVPCNI